MAAQNPSSFTKFSHGERDLSFVGHFILLASIGLRISRSLSYLRDGTFNHKIITIFIFILFNGIQYPLLYLFCKLVGLLNICSLRELYIGYDLVGLIFRKEEYVGLYKTYKYK